MKNYTRTNKKNDGTCARGARERERTPTTMSSTYRSVLQMSIMLLSLCVAVSFYYYLNEFLFRRFFFFSFIFFVSLFFSLSLTQKSPFFPCAPQYTQPVFERIQFLLHFFPSFFRYYFLLHLRRTRNIYSFLRLAAFYCVDIPTEQKKEAMPFFFIFGY